MNTITDGIVDFIANASFADTPADVRRRAVDSITDTWGVTLAGAGSEEATAAYATMRVASGAGETLALGRAGGLSILGAAFYNGTAGHAFDYDDTVLSARSHVGAHLLPTIVSAATLVDVAGSVALMSYLVGAEVEARLGAALHMRNSNLSAWHPTAVLGTIGATATACRMLGLDATSCQTALGIAVSSMSGNRLNVGTMTKPIHSGLAARNGVLSALLAREGITAHRDSVGDSTWGLLAELGRADSYDASALKDLGQSWILIGEQGLSLKPYPSCARTHAAIEAALAIQSRVKREVDRPVRIVVHTSELSSRVLRYNAPTTSAQAKFSMHFCIGAALADGEVGTATFAPEHVASQEIAVWSQLVEFAPHPRYNVDDGAEVEVQYASGKTFRYEVAKAVGGPTRWFSEERLAEKFTDCARLAGVEDPQGLYMVVSGLTGTSSLREGIANIARDHAGRELSIQNH